MTENDWKTLHKRVLDQIRHASIERPPDQNLTLEDLDRIIDSEAQTLNFPLEAQARQQLRESFISDPANPLAIPFWINVYTEDASVNEIIIAGPRLILIRRGSSIVAAPESFDDLLHVQYVIDRILRSAGVRFNAQSPAVHFAFPDRSDMVALMPPAIEAGVFVSIRPRR